MVEVQSTGIWWRYAVGDVPVTSAAPDEVKCMEDINLEQGEALI